MGENSPDYVRFKRDDSVVIGLVDPASMSDQSQMKRFGDRVVTVVEKNPNIALMLDFEHVDFVSSAALSELLRIKEAVEGAGGELRVCGLSPEILKVFEITKLAGAFGVKAGESPVAAVARFKRDIGSGAAQEA